MKRTLTLVAAIAAVGLLSATAASGSREVVQVGNLFLADNGGLFPSKLPKVERAPVSAKLIGEIGTIDGSHPPALRSVDLDVDRSVQIDAVGIPTCRLAQLQARPTGAAKRACPEAIVGSGEAEVEVAFPDGVAADIRVQAMNGGRPVKSSWSQLIPPFAGYVRLLVRRM